MSFFLRSSFYFVLQTGEEGGGRVERLVLLALLHLPCFGIFVSKTSRIGCFLQGCLLLLVLPDGTLLGLLLPSFPFPVSLRLLHGVHQLSLLLVNHLRGSKQCGIASSNRGDFFHVDCWHISHNF